MSILVGDHTRVVIQGLGRAGKFHAGLMLESGTKVVAAVKPGAGGTKWEGIPLFDTLAEAVEEEGANTSCIFVPPFGAADAIMEAGDAGLELAVCITVEATEPGSRAASSWPVPSSLSCNAFMKMTQPVTFSGNSKKWDGPT